MITHVHAWLRNIISGNFTRAAQLWRFAPKSLAAELSRRLASIEKLEAREVQSIPGIGGIYRIYGPNNVSVCEIGVMICGQHVSLTSASAITRRAVARRWIRKNISDVTFTAENPWIISDSVRHRVEGSLTNIRNCLRVSEFSCDYFVPTTASYLKLVGMDAVRGHREQWSRFDPFAGDIISRDPTDIHELAHACVCACEGWPPLIFREGLAECFAPPLDYRKCQRGGRIPELVNVWRNTPGTTDGWYSAAAVFTALIYDRFGRQEFIRLWDCVKEKTTFEAFAESCGTTTALLEKAFHEAFIMALHDGRLGASSGLLMRRESARGTRQPLVS